MFIITHRVKHVKPCFWPRNRPLATDWEPDYVAGVKKNVKTTISGLPGLNVRAPFGTLLVRGEKTVETRRFALPGFYLRKPLLIVETGRPDGSKTVGIVQFWGCFTYQTRAGWWCDRARHRVPRGSDWAYKRGVRLYGWEVAAATEFPVPLPPPSNQRGRIYTRTCFY